ncbi:sodium-dependent glucose transporter 1-like [Rhipicephalus sanguineus]|uniref:sodium-dependent glucose transporter 1-like n=1 Tax=Rhipicephalus sanguineus TaxID=34632 RepID=UPI001894090A|nr:sodium-dependent glucose transporter 1-like [Rhipicephalus sanguineus]
MGLIVALSGVALLDLGEIYDSNLSTVSQLITSRCVGGLLGSLIGGKLYDTYNTQVISIIMMSLTCITVLMIPLSGYLALAHVMVFFEGLSQGAFGTGANVWIMKMWPQNSSPALQAFHLAFGVGCLLAPLIAEPFLSTPNNSTANSTLPSANVTYNETDVEPMIPLEIGNETAADDEQHHSKVHYAFGIASGFQLLLVTSMIALYFIDSASFKTGRTNSALEGDHESPARRRFSRVALAMLSAYVCVYVAIEVTTSQMLPAFAVKCDLHFSRSLASQLAAVYFACFAASRLAAALVTIKVSAFHVLVVSHVFLVGTATVLLGWGSSNAVALWSASALAGISQGPLNAAMTAWVAAHINISNKMMSIVVVTGGLGSLSPPLLVGQFMDANPNVFSYVCFGAVMLAVAIFVGTFLYLRNMSVVSARKDLVVVVDDDRPDDALSV